jgi:hypothetical protein
LIIIKCFLLQLFSYHIVLGSSHKIIALDLKKRAESESVAFSFRTKKISVYGLNNEILEQIHKFPFPMQQMLVKEASAVLDRIAKGKGTPGLTSLDCDCLFRTQYLLPCKHIFHEHMYGITKLLTADAWQMFQEIFEESGFEIYQSRELVMVENSEQTEEERRAEKRRLGVYEIIEKLRDKYFQVEEGSAGRAEAFVKKLEDSLNPFINDCNQ